MNPVYPCSIEGCKETVDLENRKPGTVVFWDVDGKVKYVFCSDAHWNIHVKRNG